MSAEKQYSLRELVNLAYRPVTDQEFSDLRKIEPDQGVLYRKVVCLRRTGSVPRSFTFDRFANVVKHLVY